MQEMPTVRRRCPSKTEDDCANQWYADTEQVREVVEKHQPDILVSGSLQKR